MARQLSQDTACAIRAVVCQLEQERNIRERVLLPQVRIHDPDQSSKARVLRLQTGLAQNTLSALQFW